MKALAEPVSMRTVLVIAMALAVGGCVVASRPDPGATISGPLPYVENCQTCHAAPVARAYARSVHAAKGVLCGQCHSPGGHPDFTLPVQDGKCGGCHQPEYQQTLASKHFGSRQPRALNADRTARVTLRREGFIAPTPEGRRFVGDASAGALGGRLCVACHYDEHRLGLTTVQAADFCSGCHAGRQDHYPIPTPGLANRCVQCHVRAGEAGGQILNTHRFGIPGGGS
jgi:hypothetical protein